MSAKLHTIGIFSTLLFFTPTAFAQMSNVPMTDLEEDVYATAETYVNDPQWKSSGNDTSSKIKEEKCLEGNFFKMGFNRAYNEKKRDKGLKKIQKKCKKADVVVDETAYHAGYDKGLLAKCTFSYGLNLGRRSMDPSWTKCDSDDLDHFNNGYDIGKSQSSVLSTHRAKTERVTHLEDKLVLLEFDIKNGTDTAEVGTGDKLDFLKKWNRELNDARRKATELEAKYPDVFDPSQIKLDNMHFSPRHWKDQP